MATFHKRVGSLVVLSHERRTAHRTRETDEFADGTVFSAKPLQNGQLFEVQIDRKMVGFFILFPFTLSVIITTDL